MKLNWFRLLAWVILLPAGPVWAQDCKSPEQSAFQYFITEVNGQRSDLQKKKFVFDGYLTEAHSEFLSNKACFENGDQLVLDINASAILENFNDADSLNHIKKLCVPMDWREARMVPNRVKKDVMKMDVYKSTPVDKLWYVHMRLRDMEEQEDFFFEIDETFKVLRWCSVKTRF